MTTVEPEPRHDYATLTGEQLSRIADEIRPTVEGLLRLHSLLPREQSLHIVDGRLALPEGTPEDFLGWPLDYLVKAAADRVLSEDAHAAAEGAADAGGDG
jgi:hypothetical protein